MSVEEIASIPFWKRQRYRLEYFGLRLASALVCLLPWRWIGPLASFVGSVFFSFDRHRRRVTLDNLRCAFDDRFSQPELMALGRKSYGVFARTALELLWSSNLSREVLDEIITTEGLDPMPAHGAGGKPAIYFCLHAGNFEWLSQITCRHFGTFPVIAQNLKNPLLGPLFDSWRSSLGQQIMPQKGAMLRTLRHLKDGGKMGMLIDLNLKPSDGPVLIRQFGQFLTPVTRLPAELALRTGAALVPVECLPRPDGGSGVTSTGVTSRRAWLDRDIPSTPPATGLIRNWCTPKDSHPPEEISRQERKGREGIRSKKISIEKNPYNKICQGSPAIPKPSHLFSHLFFLSSLVPYYPSTPLCVRCARCVKLLPQKGDDKA
jgi:lauroyl/myristoyl acyltransferase